jgi:hypothetical protein
MLPLVLVLCVRLLIEHSSGAPVLLVNVKSLIRLWDTATILIQAGLGRPITFQTGRHGIEFLTLHLEAQECI